MIIQSLSTTPDLLGFSPLSEPAHRDLSAFLRLISTAQLAREIGCLRQRILMRHQLGVPSSAFLLQEWVMEVTCLTWSGDRALNVCCSNVYVIACPWWLGTKVIWLGFVMEVNVVKIKHWTMYVCFNWCRSWWVLRCSGNTCPATVFSLPFSGIAAI